MRIKFSAVTITNFIIHVLTIIQRTTKRAFTLLATIGICAIISCQNFTDYRTPYKNFVTISFKSRSKENSRFVITGRMMPGMSDEEVLYNYNHDNLPTESRIFLDPKENETQLTIHYATNAASTTLDAEKTLTIHYQKEAFLVSHQCGSAYKYTLNKVTSSAPGNEYKIINQELSIFNESSIDLEIYL
ncbi:MAG: DUF6452 family protein [Bacteroidota bacterium]